MYLGINLGTSRVALVLLDAANSVVASSEAPLAMSRPHPLWCEQSPASWWQAVGQAASQLRAKAPAPWQAIRAIGLSGQMHGAVLIDGRRHVLRPAMLWSDGRAFAECAWIEAAEPRTRAITGNRAMAAFTAPKLLWLREHEPQVHARIRTVLQPKDWLRLQLTGELASDCSDASGTLWLDLARRGWSEAMLAACGLTLAQVPRLVDASDVVGPLRAALVREWGLRADVLVAGGAGDNAAAAVGVGVVRRGEGFVSLGESGIVFLAQDECAPMPTRGVHTFAHALPQSWHHRTVVPGAARALSWAARATGRPDPAALLEEIATLDLPQCAQAPLFLPEARGELPRSDDVRTAGVLLGLRHEHGPAEIGRAVLEGLAFALKDGLSALTGQDGPPRELGLIGNGAHSDAWACVLASVLAVPLRRWATVAPAPAIGAARLAWLADGGDVDDVCRPLAEGDVFEPDPAVADMLQARHERARALAAMLEGHGYAAGGESSGRR